MTRTPVRGRRPGGQDTRVQILDAARESFAHQGFVRTTIRGIAGQVGVDPALVHHYFGTKDNLFVAALEIGVDPREVLPRVLGQGLDGAGHRLLVTVLSVWDDPETRLPMLALVRAGMASETGHALLHEALSRLIFAPLAAVLDGVDAQRRTGLVASQMLGLIVGRYVLRLEPLASMSVDEIAAWVGPTIQRYLDGPVP